MSETATMSDTSDNSRLLRESIRRKDQVRQLRAQLAELERERDEWRAQAEQLNEVLLEADEAMTEIEQQFNADPDEKQARINELERELMVRDRTGELQKLAKEKGIKEEHFEAMQKLMGWSPDSDEHDPAKLGEGIDALVGQYGFLRGDQAPATAGQSASRGGAAQPSQQTARAAGPGATRGAIPAPARDYDAQLAERYPNPGRLA